MQRIRRRREIVARLEEIRPILSRRKGHIELGNQTSRQQAHLHESQILADAVKRTSRERNKGIFVLDQVWARREALWDEFVCTDKIRFICIISSFNFLSF